MHGTSCDECGKWGKGNLSMEYEPGFWMKNIFSVKN